MLRAYYADYLDNHQRYMVEDARNEVAFWVRHGFVDPIVLERFDELLSELPPAD